MIIDIEKYKADRELYGVAYELFSHFGYESNWFHNTVMEKYREPWRFYHDLSHIDTMLHLIHEDYFERKVINETELEIYVMATWFHDFIYDPAATNNEELSASAFEHLFRDYKYRLEVRDLILATKDHTTVSEDDIFTQRFLGYDLAMLYVDDLDYIDATERAIFSEYQQYDWSQYRTTRLFILNKFFNALNDMQEEKRGALARRIEWLETWKPRIGLYPGSFDPFHIGHMDILEQAEQEFDKVIIMKGYNPDKKQTDRYSLGDLKTAVGWRQVIDMEEGSLTTDLITYMEELCSITLIRGLRNGDDLAYEQNQQFVMRGLKNDLKTVFFLCRHEHMHISSSMIRNLTKLRASEAKKYLPIPYNKQTWKP